MQPAGDVLSSFVNLILSQGGVVAILVLILWSGWKRLWVYGWQYDEMVADRDDWKSAARESAELTQRAVKVADATTLEIKKEVTRKPPAPPRRPSRG